MLGTTVADMGCFYIVDWQEGFKASDDGCSCEVATTQASVVDDSEVEDGEEANSLDAPVDAPMSNKRKSASGIPHPSKKKTTSNTSETPSAMAALAAKATWAKPLLRKLRFAQRKKLQG